MPMLIFCNSEGSEEIIRDGEEDRLRPSLGIIGNSHENIQQCQLLKLKRNGLEMVLKLCLIMSGEKGERQEKYIQII